MKQTLRALALGIVLTLLPGCGGCGPSGEKGQHRGKDVPRSGLDVEVGPPPVELKDGKEPPRPNVGPAPKDENKGKDAPIESKEK